VDSGKLRGVVADQPPPDTTMVVAVALLFEGTRSGVAATTRAVFVIVDPVAAVASTLTTSVKVATAPAAKLVAVQATAPVAPTEGVVQVKMGPVF
jgi:hypothetical protein